MNIRDDEGDSKKFWCFAYADDIALLGDDENDMKTSVRKFERFCKTKRLEVNLDKTKLVIFGKGRQKNREPLVMFNKTVGEKKEFRYLGITFTVNLSFSNHLCEQETKAMGRSEFLYSKMNLTKLPLELSLRLFPWYILSIISYGL